MAGQQEYQDPMMTPAKKGQGWVDRPDGEKPKTNVGPYTEIAKAVMSRNFTVKKPAPGEDQSAWMKKHPGMDPTTGKHWLFRGASYKRGGRVKRTELALLHKGEYVVPAKHRKKNTGKRVYR